MRNISGSKPGTTVSPSFAALRLSGYPDALHFPGIEGGNIVDYHGDMRVVLAVAPFLALIIFWGLAKVIYFIIN